MPNLLSAEELLKDPRCQPTAYVENGGMLYEVTDTRISGGLPGMAAWVSVRNCLTECPHEFNAVIVVEWRLIRKAAEVPDYVPEAEAA